MSEKQFKIILIAIMLLGVITSGILVKYTIDLSKKASITAFISTEGAKNEKNS